MENVNTYLNRNGHPIIRCCKNCIFWKRNHDNIGYCKKTMKHFAYTLEQNQYAMTKEFYVCEDHYLFNEDFIEKTSEKVNLKASLKKKPDTD